MFVHNVWRWYIYLETVPKGRAGFPQGGTIVRGSKLASRNGGFPGRGFARSAAIGLVIAAGMILSTGLTGAVSAHHLTASGHSGAGTVVNPLVPDAKDKKSLKSFTVGEGPQWSAYDPVSHYLYIPESTAKQIQIFNTANKLVATISTGSESYPFAAAFDGQNNWVYVTNFASPGGVWVISGKTIIHTISKDFNEPLGIAFDPGDGAMVVANSGDNNVVFLVGELVAFVTPVGNDPFDVAYDPYWGNLVVTNLLSDNVSCVSAIVLNVVGSVPVGDSPAGIAFDPATDDDYVANLGGTNLTVIGGNCAFAGTSITGFDGPYSVAFQQSTLRMFVTNLDSTTTVAVSSSDKIVKTYTTGTESNGLAYSDYTNDMYVTVFDDGVGTTVEVIP